ncbi:MAG TPA: hypothetical protein ENK44_02990 [Caldithrix abyssi]|uniref:Uncharacterized protein n=1 Tax=Caldithrix abyssi TaxID=187145 RepID=A0A7V4TYH1_CALAY|nr:hypothetical protein [Caldithrix abyssi]
MMTLKQKILRWIDYSFLFASVLALASLVAQYGFYIDPQWETVLEHADVAIILYYAVQFILKTALLDNRKDYIKKHWFETALVVIILSHLVGLIHSSGLSVLRQVFSVNQVGALTKLSIVGAQVLIVLSIISKAVRLNRRIALLKFHPAQTLILSFLFVIIIGTMLLLLPKAIKPGNVLSPLDALFTATSATCVTGLIVVDTGTYFSQLGQLIILALIQIGGLGIMTLASFLALFFGRGLGIKERVLMLEMMNVDQLGMIKKTLKSVVTITFLMEIVGAALLFVFLYKPARPLEETIYQAVFHSISAFCNAGFSLFSDSLIGWQNNPAALLTVTALIIMGGLGFIVLMELGGAKILYRKKEENFNRQWTVHTRLVLGISAILLAGGTVFIFFIEPAQGNYSGHALQAFFTSVTARTAGFNTVDMAALSLPVTLLVILLMFIGASPGSTGGGIKTTTLGVLFASLVSIIKGRTRIELYHKSISYTILNRALVIFAFSVSVIAVATILLSITESAPLTDILFEEVSAFATVGLSRGLTPTLSAWGKIIIIVSMFIGRLGPLTVALAVTAPKKKLRVEYPEVKNIMVG